MRWIDLWSIAIYDLKLTERKLLSMTPKMFHALLMRHRAKEQREDYRAGVVASLVANSVPRDDKKVLLPEDFFPSLRVGKKARGQKMSGEQMRDFIMQFRNERAVAMAKAENK